MAAPRLLRILLLGIVLLTGLGATWLLMPRAGGQALLTDGLGQGDYRLEATDGQPFTQASLRGQPSLVFFGFTHCPDVCPTTLGDILGWQDSLGPQARALRIWFVTVDPDRDTLPVLRDYVSWLPGAVGVTGSARELAQALEAFRIIARKVPLPDGGYAMDHTAYVMLFDGDGRFNQIFGYQEPADQVTAKLRRFLSSQG